MGPALLLADPGIPDTVRVDSVQAITYNSSMLPVYFFNDEPIFAAEVTLQFDSFYLHFDSFSVIGSRIEGIPSDQIISNDSSGLIDFFVYDLNLIPPGNGLLCHVYFTPGNVDVETTIEIDSTTWLLFGGGLRRTVFSDQTGQTIRPQFAKGYITIPESPGFVCGDANGDNAIDLLDILYLIAFLYNDPNGPAPEPVQLGDPNADWAINLLDILYYIAFLYNDPNGPAPQCP